MLSYFHFIIETACIGSSTHDVLNEFDLAADLMQMLVQLLSHLNIDHNKIVQLLILSMFTLFVFFRIFISNWISIKFIPLS